MKTYSKRLARIRLTQLSILLLPLFVTLCSCVAGQRTRDARGASSLAASIQWADCALPDKPYFTVEVAFDGTYRYRGHHGVRVSGERIGTLQKSSLKKLMSAAEEFHRERRGKIAGDADTAEDEPPSSKYCLLVKRQKADNHSLVITNLATNSALRFNNSADSFLLFRRDVCPGHAFNFYGNTGACPVADVLMTYEELNKCRVVHVVHVYLNGLVHYFAGGVNGSDQYSVVDAAEARALKELASGFRITRYEGVEGERQLPRFGTDEELLLFMRRVTDVSGLRFISPKEGEPDCGKQIDRSNPQREISISVE